MIALSLSDKKTATQALFVKEIFDRFLVKEITITTGLSYHIDGHVQKDYYNDDEKEQIGTREYALWKELRPVCFSLIKGKKLPLGFHITLQLEPERVSSFIERNKLSFESENVTGLYLHFQYSNDSLKAITGTSLSVFTMDKSLERAWDLSIQESFKAAGIPFDK